MDSGIRQSWQGRAARAVDRFVVWLEKDRLPILGIFLFVIALAFVRDLAEYFLLDQPFVTTSHPWIFSIAHHIAFYLIVYLGLVFLVSAFTRRGVRRCANYISMFYWIIVLPPFIDHYLGGLSQNYAYFSIDDFLNVILRFSGEAFHIGQALEVVVVLFAIFAYPIWTQRADLFTLRGRALTVVQIGFLIFFTFLFMFIMATPGLFLPVGNVGGIPQFPFFDLTKYYQYHLFLYTYYLLAGIVLTLVLTYFSLHSNFRNILHSMRLPQSLFFGAIVATGAVMGWRSSLTLNLATNIFNAPYYVNLPFAGLSVLTAVLAWQVTTIWNDLSDVDTDEPTHKRVLASGILDRRTLINISLVLMAVSVFTACLLSLQQALIILIVLFLGYLYSFKPVRFKDHFLSPLLIGLGTFLAFLFGFVTPYSVINLVPIPGGSIPVVTGEVLSPIISQEALFFGLIMFLGLVVGSMVTDIDGFQEDIKGKVRTIYTRIGLEKGARLVASLVFLVSLAPFALFKTLPDYFVFLVLGALAAFSLVRWKSSGPVLLLALLGFLYGTLRYFGAF